MLRTHTSPARGLALGLAVVFAVTSSVALAAPAKGKKKKDRPDAGDENIPTVRDPDAPTAATPPPADPPAATTTTSTSPAPTKRVNKGSAEQGLELSDQADAKFDAGDYLEAARLYTKTLQLLSENETNHVTRAIVLANAVTCYEYLYATNNDAEYLKKGQYLLQEYLRACKQKHGVGCDRYPETQEARTRLKNVMETIERANPTRPRIPPEIDAAPGGKSYDLTVDLPPAPAWIAPAFVGGVVMAAGGTALIVHGATAEAYGPLVERSLPAEGDTTDGSTDGTTDGSDTSSSSADFEIPAETKGKLLIALGAFLAAAGVGVIALSSRALAKHRRINKQNAQRLAVTPTLGRSHAGFVLMGRF